MIVQHVIYTEGVSGAEKHIAALLPLLNRQIECRLLVIHPSSSADVLTPFADAIRDKDVHVDMIVSSGSLSLKLIFQLRSYFKRNTIDIVHSHLVRTDLLVTTVKKIFHRKLFVVSTKHGYNEKVMCDYIEPGFERKKDLFWRLTKFTLRYTDYNIAVSAYIEKLFHDLGFSTASFRVIQHGLDISVPEKDQSYRKSPQQLLIVGRLEPLKGHEYVFEAMPEIAASFPACRLVLVGDGSHGSALEKKAAAAGITDRTDFLGFRKDAMSFMTNSDVLIVPSMAEAFGLVFIEAMATGLPVVAFDVPAGNEIIKDDYTGKLVPVRDCGLLAKKILLLLNNAAERNRLAANAVHEYQSSYTADAMMNNTLSFYTEILPA